MLRDEKKCINVTPLMMSDEEEHEENLRCADKHGGLMFSTIY